jgi:hypothetical protein
MSKQGIKFHEFKLNTPEVLTAMISLRGGEPREVWIDEATEDGEKRYYISMLKKDKSQVYLYFIINEEKTEVKFPGTLKYYVVDFDPKGLYANIIAA